MQYEKPFETDVHLRVAAAFRAHGIQPPAVLLRSAEVSRHDYGAPVRQTTSDEARAATS